jgi:hypothetical protein
MKKFDQRGDTYEKGSAGKAFKERDGGFDQSFLFASKKVRNTLIFMVFILHSIVRKKQIVRVTWTTIIK